jgi:hypothetical protein
MARKRRRDMEGVFETSMCTGLGDRLGMLLSLAAVARAYNLTAVTMGWCVDPVGAFRNVPMHRQHIPGWTGYDYPLATLHEQLYLPDRVRVIASDAPQVPGALKVSDRGSPRLPPAQGLPFLPWLAHELFAVGERPRVDRAAFEAAYADAGRGLRVRRGVPAYDVVVHLRAWDANTFVGADYAPAHYCTRAAVERLTEAAPWLSVAVISHNRTWARKVLGRRHLRRRLLRTDGVWEDMGVLLAARRGIVQHASEGWSAFSSVPSLARGVPLLSTYSAPRAAHRHAYFASFGPLPEHWMRCDALEAFVARVAAA